MRGVASSDSEVQYMPLGSGWLNSGDVDQEDMKDKEHSMAVMMTGKNQRLRRENIRLKEYARPEELKQYKKTLLRNRKVGKEATELGIFSCETLLYFEG